MKFVSTSIALAGMLLMAATGAQAQTPAPTPAQAQGSTFDKIQSSGKIVLGVRESSAPMAYAIGADRKYPRRPPKVLHLWPPKLLHPAWGDLMH